VKEHWKRVSPLPEDIGDRLSRIPQWFAKTGADAIYLFGSSVRKIGNDIDLAILGTGLNMDQLHLSLRDFLGTGRIDLLDLSRARNWLAFEVISTGNLLCQRNEALVNAFETKVLKLHHDEEPRRKKHLAVLRERFCNGV